MGHPVPHQIFLFPVTHVIINKIMTGLDNYAAGYDEIVAATPAFYALLALCEGIPPVTGGFPWQRPVTRSFDVFFDLRLNKRLNKQLSRRWFKTTPCSLWRHWKKMSLLSTWIEFDPDMDVLICPLKMRGEISYSFLNFNGATIDVSNRQIISSHTLLGLTRHH